jgi:hypothetical protein
MNQFADGNKRSKANMKAVICTGKAGFQTYNQTQEVINRPRARDKVTRIAYKCAHCGLWHLGTDKYGTSKSKAKDFKQRKSL